MGLFDFLKRIVSGSQPATPPPAATPSSPPPAPPRSAAPIPAFIPAARPPASPFNGVPAPSRPRQPVSDKVIQRAEKRRQRRAQQKRRHVLLRPLNYSSSLIRTPRSREVVKVRPYRFAFGCEGRAGHHLDQSQDADQRWLDYYGLPAPSKPEELASWLGLPIGRLAWLTCHDKLPSETRHYHCRWLPKKSGGLRLIEVPKPELKRVQVQILRQILDKVPTHPAAHGFVAGRSILSNAAPHTGQRFVLKLDLENFYGTVKYDRVVAIFRALGYSRVVAIWLARLTTAEAPSHELTDKGQYSRERSLACPSGRHLPQGAPTSPALANLSAFGLDVRLAGMSRAYGITYTRYADDLTFSGPGVTVPGLREFIPLVKAIIHSERFVINSRKTRIVRNNQRQCVTGVVVNAKPNCSRTDFDQLKALLHNCLKLGPGAQNRDQRDNFPEHLRGRIAHIAQLNPRRGAKLLAVYNQIDWEK